MREKYFRYLWITREWFPSDQYYSYSHSQVLEFKNYSYSYSYNSWLRKSIPIPILGENNYSLITVTKLHQKFILRLNSKFCIFLAYSGPLKYSRAKNPSVFFWPSKLQLILSLYYAINLYIIDYTSWWNQETYKAKKRNELLKKYKKCISKWDLKLQT